MSKEKLVIGFLLVLIAVFSYMIGTLVYKESFKGVKNNKGLEVSLNE